MGFLLCSKIVGKAVAFVQHSKTNVNLYPFTRIFSTLTEADENYLSLAVEYASQGLGKTYPNPAVGCVIVSDGEIVGAGFHPKAGMPHAEVFALLAAAGHIEDGVAASKSMYDHANGSLQQKVIALSQEYLASGPDKLFKDMFAANDKTTTAYVTLEPCCHYGQTPPCTVSLIKAKVDRVVVGFRDPNPRVDGGGFRMLKDAGISVVEASGNIKKDCANLVTNFVKRITPRDSTNYAVTLNGSKRRALRGLAGRQKANKSLTEVALSSRSGVSINDEESLEAAVTNFPLDPSWMEATDDQLWKHELLLLRLNNSVKKKKEAKLLGQRIAENLGAHVVQVVGHTALLYRPSIPPRLDLETLVKGNSIEDGNDN